MANGSASETNEPADEARLKRDENAPKRVVGRPFEKGNSGRPLGAIGRRTWAKREVLDFLAKGDEDLLPREERLKILLNSRDHSIRMQAEKFIADHEWGKPRETHEHSGLNGGPLEFVGMTLEQKREVEQKLLHELRLIEAPEDPKS